MSIGALKAVLPEVKAAATPTVNKLVAQTIEHGGQTANLTASMSRQYNQLLTQNIGHHADQVPGLKGKSIREIFDIAAGKVKDVKVSLQETASGIIAKVQANLDKAIAGYHGFPTAQVDDAATKLAAVTTEGGETLGKLGFNKDSLATVRGYVRPETAKGGQQLALDFKKDTVAQGIFHDLSKADQGALMVGHSTAGNKKYAANNLSSNAAERYIADGQTAFNTHVSGSTSEVAVDINALTGNTGYAFTSGAGADKALFIGKAPKGVRIKSSALPGSNKAVANIPAPPPPKTAPLPAKPTATA